MIHWIPCQSSKSPWCGTDTAAQSMNHQQCRALEQTVVDFFPYIFLINFLKPLLALWAYCWELEMMDGMKKRRVVLHSRCSGVLDGVTLSS